MINIRTIRKLMNNEGLTLKNGKIITYKSGWQVADYGIEAKSAEEAIKAVRAMGGNCGIWVENGIYYIDHSFRVNTKRDYSFQLHYTSYDEVDPHWELIYYLGKHGEVDQGHLRLCLQFRQ